MTTTDVRGHTVPTSTEHPSRQGWVLSPLLSVKDPIVVTSTTDRTTKLSDLAAAGITPSLTNPIIFFRSNGYDGRQLEYTTDGTTFHTLPASIFLEKYRARGTGTIPAGTLASGEGTSVAVSFGKTFSSIPKVVVSLSGAPSGTVFLVPRAINATTTGFTLYVYNVGASSWAWTSGLTVDYIADWGLPG